jgi:hypothetical protein
MALWLPPQQLVEQELENGKLMLWRMRRPKWKLTTV